MTRPRDQQRIKVYRAERALRNRFQFGPDISLTEVEAFIIKIMDLKSKPGQRKKWQKAEYVLSIRDGRGCRYPSANTNGQECRLTFPKGTRNAYSICHEVAHLLAWNEGAFHGPAFCRALIQLVREFIGPFQAAALVEEMLKNKVKITE